MRAAQSKSVRELLAKRSCPRLFTIEAEYRWALEAAELDWTRRLIADIRSGSLDGLELWRGFHARRG